MIAIATNGKNGLKDVVSNVFGRAKTFTIIEVEDGKIDRVNVLQNPAVSYNHGAGPIVVKMLVDTGVDLVLAYQLGLGAEGLLKQHNVQHIPVLPKTNVREAVELALCSLKKEDVIYEI